MSVFAISDLHLSQVHPKPMEIFGQHWQNYMRKIEECWRDMILPEDTVLIAGDISWAMKIEDAVPDLERIRAGTTIIGGARLQESARLRGI